MSTEFGSSQGKGFIWKVAAVVGVILAFLFTNPFATNDSGYRTHIQRVNSEEITQFDAGVYYAGFFAKIVEYPDVITVQFEREENKKDDISHFEDPTKCQFADGTYADAVGFTVKWELPDDNDTMLQIHKDYRSPLRLAASLADYSKECIQYSFQLMDSERHYSGGKSELRDYFQYQLRNGQYIVDTYDEVVIDSVTGESKRVYRQEIRKKDNGEPDLSLSDIQRYRITPNFVAITLVDYEPLVDEKLKAKVEQSTKESISKQTLSTAQQEALTAKALGDKKIAETKATEEASKLEAVIRKQKEVELAKLSADKAKFDAQKVKYDGDAEAAKNRALVSAGLSPERAAEFNNERAIGVAAELAKMQWPKMMIFGGGEGGPMNPFDAIALDKFMDLQKRITEENK